MITLTYEQKKAILSAFLIFCAFVAVVFFLASYTDTNKADNHALAQTTYPSATTPPPETTKPLTKIDYEFSDASELMSQYRKNPVSANLKYNGKTIQVTGKINYISYDSNSKGEITTIYIQLQGTKGLIMCIFNNKSDFYYLSNFSERESITVLGIVGKYYPDNWALMFNKCVPVKE